MCRSAEMQSAGPMILMSDDQQYTRATRTPSRSCPPLGAFKRVEAVRPYRVFEEHQAADSARYVAQFG